MKTPNYDQIMRWVGPETMADGKESANHYHHRHAQCRRYTTPHGRALRAMLEGWALYADAHRDQCDSPVGEDNVLCDPWRRIGESLGRLLDGELGGWDGGSLAHNIAETLKRAEVY